MKAIRIDEVTQYVCDDDSKLPESEQTVWHLGVLDSIVRSVIEDAETTYEVDEDAPPGGRTKTSLNLYQAQLEYFRFGVKKVDNFIGGDGKPVDLVLEDVVRGGKKYNVVSDDFIKLVPVKYLGEIATKIALSNQVTRSEQKN